MFSDFRRAAEPIFFALSGAGELGVRVAEELGAPPADHEEREFENGEHKARPLVNVRGRDAFVLQGLHGDDRQSVNDRLCRLLFFAGAVRDAGAARVTAVVPYLCYSRKDQKTKPRDPVTTRYVARLFEAVEVDRVVTMDVHNLAAYQNAFRIGTEHLEARPLLVDHFVPLIGDGPVAVVSPDPGGVRRADRFRESLAGALGREVGSAFLEKKRSEGVVTGQAVVGRVEGATAVIVDDLISTGTTLARGARACVAAGADAVHAAATHGLFVEDANRVLSDPALAGVVVTNTVPPFRLVSDAAAGKLTVLDAAPLLAEAIRRIHEGGSIVELLAD